MTSTAKAAKLDGEIRKVAAAMQTVYANFEQRRDRLMDLLAEAKALEKDFLDALGHKSWSAYLVDAIVVTSDNTAQRKVCAQLLRKERMSLRGIAAVLGVSKSQIARDVAEVSLDGTVDSLDGNQRPSTARRRQSRELTPERRCQKVCDDLDLDVSRLINYIEGDAEFEDAAKGKLDRLVQISDDLNEAISRLRPQLPALVLENRARRARLAEQSKGQVVSLDVVRADR